MKPHLFAFLLATCCVDVSADTRLEIVTAEGFVSFVADENWPVVSMQAKPPISTFIFQLPNAADEGTQHSTNLILVLFDKSPPARQAFDAPIQQLGKLPAVVETWHGWTVTRQSANQGKTAYTILDAKRADVGDVSATVRLAWPNLPANPATYDQEMEATFLSFISAIEGRPGTYTPTEGATVRRPVR